MLILLPPSEGKSTPRRGKPLALGDLSFPGLTAARERALAALVELCGVDPELAARTLGLGTTQIDEVRRNHLLPASPTARADAIYTGVLYDALDLASLDSAARRRASRSLAITSSLFGLVRPGDRIPSYRLAGGVNLPGIGVVSAHWRDVLDPVVREAAGNGLVVDLRSTTYAAFWRPAPDLARKVATVHVLQQVGDERKVVSHFNKATKGRLVRALLESGASPGTPAQLADHITALGWKVELHEPARTRQQLDVVVEEV
ncbi:MAG: peroxide stress protein YaaA [Marmoricola sp.]|nr:peroxide stress protein YaaA [Marmoricola sp.]